MGVMGGMQKILYRGEGWPKKGGHKKGVMGNVWKRKKLLWAKKKNAFIKNLINMMVFQIMKKLILHLIY